MVFTSLHHIFICTLRGRKKIGHVTSYSYYAIYNNINNLYTSLFFFFLPQSQMALYLRPITKGTLILQYDMFKSNSLARVLCVTYMFSLFFFFYLRFPKNTITLFFTCVTNKNGNTTKVLVSPIWKSQICGVRFLKPWSIGRTNKTHPTESL